MSHGDFAIKMAKLCLFFASDCGYYAVVHMWSTCIKMGLCRTSTNHTHRNRGYGEGIQLKVHLMSVLVDFGRKGYSYQISWSRSERGSRGTLGALP